MPSYNYVFSKNSFQTEDATEQRQFPIFGTLNGHMKSLIMRGFTPVTLIALAEADPSLSHLAKEVIRRKVLDNALLEYLAEEDVVQLWLEYDDKDMDCVKFPNETRDRSGELEMYRKAFTFLIRICSVTKSQDASISIETNYAPNNLHLLHLPSLDQLISVKKLTTQVNVPVEFISQINATEIRYENPGWLLRAGCRVDKESDLASHMATLVEDYVSSPKI